MESGEDGCHHWNEMEIGKLKRLKGYSSDLR
jgi:hypothetical protein